MQLKEKLENIKKQLIDQINSDLSQKQKLQETKQINPKDNSNVKEHSEKKEDVKINKKMELEQQCIFCAIISKQIPSYNIGENKKAIAVLELNPISKGHILIIPKQHLSSRKEFSDEIFLLANKLKQKIKDKFNPKDIGIFTQNIMGHEILNILPIYKNENINSPRKKISSEELEKLQKQLTEETKKIQKDIKKNIKDKKIKELNAKDFWINPRIP